MHPSYTDNDPRGWCGDPRRGAAMGRPSIHVADLSAPIKFHVRYTPLDQGGYDRNGTYFGTGMPLYWVASTDGEVDYMLRARDRDHAKRLVLERYTAARFFR